MNCRVGIIIKHGYNQRPRQLKIYQKLVYVVLIYEANSLTVLTFFETFKKLKTQNSFMISFSKNKINLSEKNPQFSACIENRKILPKLCIYGYDYECRKNIALIACLKLIV